MLKLNRYAKDLNDKMAEVRLAAQTLEKWANTLLLRSQKNMFNMHRQIYPQLDHRLGNLESKIEDRCVELSSKIDRTVTLEQVEKLVFNSFQLMLKEEWNRKSIQNWPTKFISSVPRNSMNTKHD